MSDGSYVPAYRAEPPRYAPSIFDSKSKMQLTYDKYGVPIWLPVKEAKKLPIAPKEFD